MKKTFLMYVVMLLAFLLMMPAAYGKQGASDKKEQMQKEKQKQVSQMKEKDNKNQKKIKESKNEKEQGVQGKKQRRVEKKSGSKEKKNILEENKHIRRLAKMDRIEALAKEKNNTVLLEKVQKMRDLENKRHKKVLQKLTSKQTNEESINKSEEKDQAKGE